MKNKKAYKVPMIRIDPRTGEKVRFESMSEAAKSVGVRTCQIHEAWLFEKVRYGFLWKKEGE